MSVAKLKNVHVPEIRPRTKMRAILALAFTKATHQLRQKAVEFGFEPCQIDVSLIETLVD